MPKRFFFLLLFFLISLGFFLRFWGLEQLPPTINRDEASIGYNAYSILKTGRDEWGYVYPLSFKSFGDYKMPAYIYLTVLPVKLWGLSVFSVRFCSALSGSFSLVLFYFLCLWVFKKFSITKLKYKWWALLGVMLFSLNPWHLFFSRMAFEANLNLVLLLGAITAFLYGLQKRWLWLISALSFVLMLYTYSSSFIFLPGFFLLLLLIFRQEIFSKRDIFLTVSLLILTVGVLHATWAVWQVSSAKSNITIFSDPSTLDAYNHLRFQVFEKSPLWAKIWLNKPFYYLRILLNNYLLSFSPSFLFINGSNHPWHRIPGMGQFYWLDSMLMISGLALLLKKGFKKINFLLFGWLILSPLPSAVTIDAPHATRMLHLIPVLLIILVLGWVNVAGWLWRQKDAKKLIFMTFFGLLCLFQVVRFSYLYILVYPKKIPPSMFPGIKQALEWTGSRDKNRLMIFSQPLDFPYIYVAFYTKYDPALFQRQAIWKPPNLANLVAVEELGRYRFWEGEVRVEEKAYYLLQQSSIEPGGFTLVNQIMSNDIVTWNIYAN